MGNLILKILIQVAIVVVALLDEERDRAKHRSKKRAGTSKRRDAER